MISEFALLIFATPGGVAVGLYVAATLIPVKEKKKMNLLITAIPLVLLAISGVVVAKEPDHGFLQQVPGAQARREFTLIQDGCSNRMADAFRALARTGHSR